MGWFYDPTCQVGALGYAETMPMQSRVIAATLQHTLASFKAPVPPRWVSMSLT